MVATISPEPRLQFFANDGSFLVGGKLYTYAAGTTTPLATYTTSTGLIANTNPIILDSRGEASVWLTSSKYKFVLKNANDVEIWSQDQLQGYANADGSNAYGTWPISITGNAATATLATTATYATTAGAVTPGAAVTSITGAGLYGFTLPGGPITSTGTLTVTPPVPSTAGNVLTSNGSAWVSAANTGGKILQVVQGVLATKSSTSSASFSDTGLTVNITPTSASNKILVMVTIGSTGSSTAYGTIGLRLVRNSTNIAQGSVTGSETAVTSGDAQYSTDKSSGSSQAITYLDSPATTSSTTYKIQFASLYAYTSPIVQINGTYNDGGGWAISSYSTITVMEIGA